MLGARFQRGFNVDFRLGSDRKNIPPKLLSKSGFITKSWTGYKNQTRPKTRTSSPSPTQHVRLQFSSKLIILFPKLSMIISVTIHETQTSVKSPIVMVRIIQVRLFRLFSSSAIHGLSVRWKMNIWFHGDLFWSTNSPNSVYLKFTITYDKEQEQVLTSEPKKDSNNWLLK